MLAASSAELLFFLMASQAGHGNLIFIAYLFTDGIATSMPRPEDVMLSHHQAHIEAAVATKRLQCRHAKSESRKDECHKKRNKSMF